MSNELVTAQQVAEMLRIGEHQSNNRASTLWAIFAFACMGIFIASLIFAFVWWNYGLHNATWLLAVMALVLIGVGGAAMVSAWNDRVQARALDMMKTFLVTQAQYGQSMPGIDNNELRRQNAITQGVQQRLELKQSGAASGFVFDDDDAEIIEVKPS